MSSDMVGLGDGWMDGWLVGCWGLGWCVGDRIESKRCDVGAIWVNGLEGEERAGRNALFIRRPANTVSVDY